MVNDLVWLGAKWLVFIWRWVRSYSAAFHCRPPPSLVEYSWLANQSLKCTESSRGFLTCVNPCTRFYKHLSRPVHWKADTVRRQAWESWVDRPSLGLPAMWFWQIPRWIFLCLVDCRWHGLSAPSQDVCCLVWLCMAGHAKLRCLLLRHVPPLLLLVARKQALLWLVIVLLLHVSVEVRSLSLAHGILGCSHEVFFHLLPWECFWKSRFGMRIKK
jgi:hypothetical protein